jgi:DNA-directed RNA polymerase subunit RPC12/RpoP
VGCAVTTLWRCDRCGAELEPHREGREVERAAWALRWDHVRRCMGHECPTCTGREVKKRRAR